MAADLPEPPLHQARWLDPDPLSLGMKCVWAPQSESSLGPLCVPPRQCYSCAVFYEFVFHVKFTRPRPCTCEIVTFKTQVLNRPGGANLSAIADDTKDADGLRHRGRAWRPGAPWSVVEGGGGAPWRFSQVV